ncbi:EAL domain-containing protein [Octadecabacter temperatus]|uniref:sensor domain-containing protein n=1 Tax=Octadecabacter temperatus TaxID=1458307 RepID=UPI001F2C5F66|nr:EAL domain-containing protein [Octadecabacter temperatus]
MVQDLNAKTLWANQAYADIHNLDLNNIIGRSPLEYALPKDKTPTKEEIQDFRYDPDDPKWNGFELVKNQRPDGSEFWNQISISFVKNSDGAENAIVVCRDVTEQVTQENQLRKIGYELEHQASHDSLTGIPNRAAFLAFISQEMAAPDRAAVGLLHIDLDNSKAINDTHGHSGGDAVLRHTANIIQGLIRDSDLVARVGGDEFVVVCPLVNNPDFLTRFSSQLLNTLAEPFEWNGRKLQVEASIGAAVSQSRYDTPEDLLVRSDFALYEAKHNGRYQVVTYDTALRDQHAFQTRRERELADAIDGGNLDFFFQPQLCLRTGEIIGMETLVRWIHPSDGLIEPNDFLTLVRDLGLLGVMDLSAMDAALAEKRRLNLAGFDDIGVAFNASPELLAHPDFINRLVWAVEAGEIDRSQITIEVLETTNFGDATHKASHAAIIHDLRHAGFGVHLDDFGIGFAGLSHLAALDVSGVKIDRGLVSNLLNDTTCQKIVRKIIELSNDLGLIVTAEGVEDALTATALQEMGCSVIQGYWLSKPMPSENLIGWIENQDRHTHPLRA